MKILSSDKAENCIDGDFVYIYSLDSPWTKDSIQALEALGRLKYYASFPKPMFRLDCSDSTIIKGVQGTNECRAIYGRNITKQAKERFEKRFEDIIHE